MGGVPGSLLKMWCSSGFSTATVAASLTFFPPDASYSLHKRDDGGFEVILAGSGATSPTGVGRTPTFRRCHPQLEAYVLPTPSKSRIPVFLLRQPGAEVTIIYSHGNATDLGGMYRRYLDLFEGIQPKVNLVAYDYSGYGVASGKPTEKGTYEDLEAVYDWALQKLTVGASGGNAYRPMRFILYGQSVGSGPTVRLASRRAVSGVVVHSGILSGMRVLTDSRMLACLDIYPNIHRIKHIRCPTFIIHGQEDKEVTFNHGVRLYNALRPEARHEPWWVPEVGHNNVCQGAKNKGEYLKRMSTFVARIVANDAMDGVVAVKTARSKNSVVIC
mmetsp:Transcript_20155/g.61172  ORF Transcript_20155/g.61172 Transcript_20155/m.61172 type:complete len:330 (-) Transcript_20155:1670-2659(-)